MSWDFSGKDAWETATMSSTLPTNQAKDEDQWGSWEDTSINTGPADPTTEDPNPGNNEDMSFGYTDPEPVQDDTCRRCKKPGHFAKNCPEPIRCFNCGQPGHNKVECTNPRKFQGACRSCGVEGHHSGECPDKPKRACFNCGQEGHTKGECPNPKSFNGPCKYCTLEGHAPSDCPEKPEFKCHNCGEPGHASKSCPHKPAPVCRNCGLEGHVATDCSRARNIHQDREGQPILPEKDIWRKLSDADKDADLDEFRTLLFEHSRACPEITIKEYEQRFRSEKFQIHLIAMETSPIGNQTLVNFQGIAGQRYVVRLQLGPEPKRKRLVQALSAPTTLENLVRLENAGFQMDGFDLFCIRCKCKGHTSKTCPEERPESVTRRDQNTVRDRPAFPSGSAWVLPPGS